MREQQIICIFGTTNYLYIWINKLFVSLVSKHLSVLLVSKHLQNFSAQMAKRRLYDSNSSQSEEGSDSSAASFSTIKSSDFEDLQTSLPGSEEYTPELPAPFIVEESAPLPSAPLTDAQQYELQTKLRDYLTGTPKYVKAIKSMCTSNGESMLVEFADLLSFHAFLESDPSKFLDTFSSALQLAVSSYFPHYSKIRPQVYARIINLPVTECIRDLRNSHLNRLVRVHGIVTRRSAVFSLYSIVRFTCVKCRASFGPFIGKDLRPTACFECQSRGPFVVNTGETVYKDFQRITLQEVPGTVPPGTLPRAKEVLLYNDLIDICRPGDEVDVTGVYKNNIAILVNVSNGFPLFSTIIEASSVVRKQDEKDAFNIGETKMLRQLARTPDIIERLVESTAPSIFGHKTTKLALLLAMVGGEPKERDGMCIRGDINLLLMGDPGTAKSQFLRYVHETAQRAVMATGQGSSGVGLTASVKRDTAVGEWVLEGGALVLADRGVCCIDEFDKMNETDRVSIHEAMEQQSVSVSKAGIVASLHARCAVIAAANPTRGCYNPSLTFSQNVNLSDPILSRFDLLCVVRDIVDVREDTEMARFILRNHRSPGTDGIKMEERQAEPISQEILKKYIAFARNSVHPVISHLDVQKISQLYLELRRESISSGIPITVRHVESIIRISEAFAKLRLADSVTARDIDAAIRITLKSFLGAQKQAVEKRLRKKFARYFEENVEDVALYILKKMIAERIGAVGSGEVPSKDFIARCTTSGLNIGERFFSSERFTMAGFRVKDGFISREVS